MQAFSLPPVDAVLASVSPGELRIAVTRAGRPWELAIARPSRPTLIGNVYLGRVRRVEPALDAAFVDIGTGEPAFLSLAPAARPSEGEALLLQVTADPVDGKGPVVSRRIALPGRYLVYTPGRPGTAAGKRFADPDLRRRLQGLLLGRLQPDEGAIVRNAAASAGEAALAAELEALRALWAAIRSGAAASDPPALLHADLPALPKLLRDRAPVVPVLIDDATALAAARRYAGDHAPELVPSLQLWREREPLFEAHGIEGEIEAARDGSAPLPSGGALHLGTSRALTAIDVDSATHPGRGRSGDMLLSVNLEAAVEAARLIRLRNIGGLIVIDFAGAPQGAAARAVDARLRAAFAEDVAETRLVPMSVLGLVELSRQRLGPSLASVLGETCPTCEGRGVIGGAESTALAALRAVLRLGGEQPGARPVLAADPETVAVLQNRLGPALRETEERLGQPLALVTDPALRAGRTRLEFVR